MSGYGSSLKNKNGKLVKVSSKVKRQQSPGPSYIANSELNSMFRIEKDGAETNSIRFTENFKAAALAKATVGNKDYINNANAPSMTLNFQKDAVQPYLFQTKLLSLKLPDNGGKVDARDSSKILSNESINEMIQASWNCFSQLIERDRFHMLKGLLKQCTSTQLDDIQSTLTQLQVERRHNVASKFSVTTDMPKIHTTAAKPPHTERAATAPAAKNAVVEALLKLDEQDTAQSDLYMRLFNDSFDVNKLLGQLEYLPQKELVGVLRGLAQHTRKQQKLLDLVQWVGNYANASANQKLQSPLAGNAKPDIAKIENKGAFTASIIHKVLECAKFVTSSVNCSLYVTDSTENTVLVAESTWIKPIGRSVVREQLLCHDAIAKGQPVNMYSIKTSDEYTKTVEDFYRNLKDAPPKCVLAVPVLHPERSKTVVGVLELVNKCSGPPYFGADEHEFAVILSRLLSVLLLPLDSTALVAHVRKTFASGLKQNDSAQNSSAVAAAPRQSGFQGLWMASQLVSRDLDMKSLVRALAEQSKSLVHADRAAVFVVDHPNQQLWSTHANGESEIIRFAMNRGIAGHVACTGELVNVADAYLDDRFNQEVDKKTGYRTRSLLCAPIINEDQQVVAVMQMLNKLPEGSAFSKEDEDCLMTFSSCAGTAIDRTSKFEMLQKQLMTAQFENTVSREVQANLPFIILTLDNHGRLLYLSNPKAINLTDAEHAKWKTSRYDTWLCQSRSSVSASRENSAAKQQFLRHIASVMDNINQPPVSVNYADLDVVFPSVDLLWNTSFSKWERKIHYFIKRLPYIPSGSSANADVVPTVFVMLADVVPVDDVKLMFSRSLPEFQVDSFVSSTNQLAPQLAGTEQSTSVLSVLGHPKATSDSSTFSADASYLHKFVLLTQQALRESAQASSNMRFQGIVDHSLNGQAAASALFGVPCAKVSTDGGELAELAYDAVSAALLTLSLAETQQMKLTIGVSFGKVLSGLFGGVDLGAKLSGIGRPFQISKALSKLASIYEVQLIVDEHIYALTKDRFIFRELDRIHFEDQQQPKPADALQGYPGFVGSKLGVSSRANSKGAYGTLQHRQVAPSTVFEVVGVVGQELPHEIMTSLICFELGRNEYRAGNFEQALAQFQKAGLLMSDPPSKLYSSRCETMLEIINSVRESDSKFISQPWDGTWVYNI